ncbi:MAG TPA: isochorismatase family protein [Steroidobacteraceae bacterium]|jgi:nicotinamidase-related amidase
MPLTKLDDVTALVIIDLQKGIAAMAPQAAGDVISRSARLARAFREKKLPVILVNVAGTAPGRTDTPRPNFSALPADFAELVPELQRQPGDHLVTKHAFGAFINTDLDSYLRKSGATQIVLTGIATSIGVESTARSLYDAGYNVSFAVDAMADRVAENHRHSVETVFPRLGESGSTDDVLRLLNAR